MFSDLTWGSRCSLKVDAGRSRKATGKQQSWEGGPCSWGPAPRGPLCSHLQGTVCFLRRCWAASAGPPAPDTRPPLLPSDVCDQTACSTCVSHSPSVLPSSDVVSTHLLCVFCWPALSIMCGHGLPPDFLRELGSRPSLSDLLGELGPWITNEPSPPGGSGTFEPHPAHSTSGYRI